MRNQACQFIDPLNEKTDQGLDESKYPCLHGREYNHGVLEWNLPPSSLAIVVLAFGDGVLNFQPRTEIQGTIITSTYLRYAHALSLRMLLEWHYGYWMEPRLIVHGDKWHIHGLVVESNVLATHSTYL
jgi:hypothetical protein